MKALYGLGRFVQPGAAGNPLNPVFKSPAYLFSVPTTLRSACAAMVPGEKDSLGNDRVGIKMKIQPCDLSGGAMGSAIPVGEVDSLLDLSELGEFGPGRPAAGFQYVIEFYEKNGGGPLYQTPFFESIWFALEPKRAPAWTVWE